MAELIDEEFADWMETVYVVPFAGAGAWNDVPGAFVEVSCHWSAQNKVVTTSDGKTVTSSVQIQAGVRWRDTLNLGARVSLSLDDDKVYTVVAAKRWPGSDSQLEVDLV